METFNIRNVFENHSFCDIVECWCSAGLCAAAITAKQNERARRAAPSKVMGTHHCYLTLYM
jgi:hypothetical protein